MKKLLLFLSIIATFVLSAQETSPIIYNMPARVKTINGADYYASAGFIFWKAKEDNLELGTERVLYGSDNTRSTINMSFKYHPGFKVEVGANLPNTNSFIKGEYTHLYAKNEKHAYTNLMTDFWTVTASMYTSLRNWWKLAYDSLDITMERPLYSSPKLALTPEFGFKLGFIDQRYIFRDISDAWGDEHDMGISDSFLVGPLLGFKTKWLLGKYFYLTNKTSLSIFYQYFYHLNINDKSRETYSNNDIKRINSYLGTLFGIGAGNYFHSNKLHYDFVLSYDFHYYWNQNEIHNKMSTFDGFQTQSSGLITAHGFIGDLFLHGLTFKAQIDF